jgi:hypothetical protein
MTPAEVIAHVKAIGGTLVLAPGGDWLSYVLPSNAKATLEEIQRQRNGILELLKHGENETVLVGNDGDALAWVEEDVLNRPMLSELICEWLGHHCAVSSRFSTSLLVLHREFSRWAGFQEDAGVHDAFTEQLGVFGFLTDEFGMVNGIAINSDVIAALVYEQPQASFPGDFRYIKKGGIFMPFIVSSKPEYEIPDEGEHQGVLADVVDKGEVPTQFGLKKMVGLTFLLDQYGKDGKPMRASRRVSQSLHPSSTLRQIIKSMLGKDPGDTFDLEKLIGTNAWLEIERHENGGRTYANIVGIRRVRKGDRVLAVPPDFKRFTGKPDKNGNNGGKGTDVHNQNIHGVDVTDDDMPDFPEK